MLVYYPQFDVVLILDSGEQSRVVGEDLDFYNVTQSAAIDTLTTDTDGSIPQGSFDDGTFDVAVGDVIEVSHATFPGTARFVLCASAEEAAYHVENHVATLVLEDNYSTDAPDSAVAVATIQGTDAKPFTLGGLQIGMNYIPYQSTVGQTLNISIGSSKKDHQFSAAQLELLPTQSVVIPAPSGGSGNSIFEIYEPLTTIGTSEEVLHSHTIPADRLQYDGDKLIVRYAGVFQSGFGRETKLKFGEDYFSTSTTAGGPWELDIYIIRIAVDSYAFKVTFTISGETSAISKDRLNPGDIDFSVAQDIQFLATDGYVEETKIEIGYCLFFPAAEIDIVPPSAPVLDPVTIDSDTEITLDWSASTDDVGVAGYQYRVDGGSWVDVGNVLTFQVTGLSASTSYDFEVRAYDSAANFSSASNLESGTTDAPPPPIAFLTSTRAINIAMADAVSPAIDTTGATLLVIAQVAAAGDSVAPTDSKGNTWIPLTERIATNLSTQLWYCLNPIVGTGHTFTAVWDVASYASLAVAAFENVKNEAPAFETGNGTTGTTLQPGSITPPENDCLVVTGFQFVDLSNPGDASIGSGFTVAENLGSSGSGLGCALAYKIQTTATAENPTWNSNLGSERISTAMTVFKNI